MLVTQCVALFGEFICTLGTALLGNHSTEGKVWEFIPYPILSVLSLLSACGWRQEWTACSGACYGASLAVDSLDP